VFVAALLLLASSCKKKVPAPPPPPPPPAAKVEPPPPPALAPRIDAFAVQPRVITRGQSATLNWTVANATDISIDQGIGAVQATGTRSVNPSTPTNYTLTARGPGGMDTRTVNLDVTIPLPPPPPPQTKAPTVSGADMLGREAQDAYFDYDKSEIRDDARQALTRDADLLKRIFAADPNFTVVIEGHCDERGSAEYNLGLGDRRSTTAKDFLVQLGVPADRLKSISYGKERPVCTDANEACYQRNRRAHLAPAQ